MAVQVVEVQNVEAEAVMDCKIVPIDQKRFTFLIQQNLFFAIQVMTVMAEWLRRLMGVTS